MTIPRPFLLALPVLLCLVALAVFYAGFQAPWYYDSMLLPDNLAAFAGQGLGGVINLFPQRPVPMASFYLNYLVSGMDPFAFRIVNAVLLGLSASGVMAVFLLLMETPALAEKGTRSDRTAFAFLFCLLFLVHPVQTYLVLYVWQRMALLACLFSVCAFATYLATRMSRIEPPFAGYVLCFLLYGLAVTSKENAIALAPVLVLAEIAFFRPSLRELSIRTGACVGCSIALVVLLSFLERPHGTDAQSAGIVNTLAKYYQESGLTLKQVCITQCRLLFEYVSVILWPLPSKVLLVTPKVVYGSLWDSPGSMAAVAAACGLPLVGLYALWKRPLTGFGILFFFVNLLPEALLVPQFLFFVYRAALPMVGLFLILLDAILFLLGRCPQDRVRAWVRTAVMTGLAAAIVAAGSVTWSKAQLWADPVRLWTEVVNHMPRDREKVEKRTTVNAINNLGIALQKRGSAADAAFYHRMAVDADPLNARSRVLLAKAYIRDGKMAEALSAVQEAIAVSPGYAEAHMGLAIVLMEQNRLSEASEHAKRAIDLEPNNSRYHHDLGAILLKRSEYREAVAHLSRATELNPAFGLAHYQLAKALWADRKPEKAIEHLRRSLDLNPDNVRARNDLAGMLAKANRVDEAIAQLRAILEAHPEDSVARANLARLLNRQISPQGTGIR
jgi:protein O-mannosyl-transferase